MQMEHLFSYPLYSELWNHRIVDNEGLVIADRRDLEKYKAFLEEVRRLSSAEKYEDRKCLLDQVQELLKYEERTHRENEAVFSLLDRLGLVLVEDGFVALKPEVPTKEEFLGAREPCLSVWERQLIEQEQSEKVLKGDLKQLDEWLGIIGSSNCSAKKPVYSATTDWKDLERKCRDRKRRHLDEMEKKRRNKIDNLNFDHDCSWKKLVGVKASAKKPLTKKNYPKGLFPAVPVALGRGDLVSTAKKLERPVGDRIKEKRRERPQPKRQSEKVPADSKKHRKEQEFTSPKHKNIEKESKFEKGQKTSIPPTHTEFGLKTSGKEERLRDEKERKRLEFFQRVIDNQVDKVLTKVESGKAIKDRKPSHVKTVQSLEHDDSRFSSPDFVSQDPSTEPDDVRALIQDLDDVRTLIQDLDDVRTLIQDLEDPDIDKRAKSKKSIHETNLEDTRESSDIERKPDSLHSASDDKGRTDQVKKELMHMKRSDNILKSPAFRRIYDSLKPTSTHKKIAKEEKAISLPLSSERIGRKSSKDILDSPVVGRRHDSLQSFYERDKSLPLSEELMYIGISENILKSSASTRSYDSLKRVSTHRKIGEDKKAKSIPFGTELIRKVISEVILESPDIGRKHGNFQSASEDRKQTDYEGGKSLSLSEQLMHIKSLEDIFKIPAFRRSFDSLKTSPTHTKIGEDEKVKSLPFGTELIQKSSSEKILESLGRKHDSLQSASQDRKRTDYERDNNLPVSEELLLMQSSENDLKSPAFRRRYDSLKTAPTHRKIDEDKNAKSLPSGTEQMRKSSSEEIFESPVVGEKPDSLQSSCEREKSLPISEELMHLESSEDILKSPAFRRSYDSSKRVPSRRKIGEDKKAKCLPLGTEQIRESSSEEILESPVIGRKPYSFQSFYENDQSLPIREESMHLQSSENILNSPSIRRSYDSLKTAPKDRNVGEDKKPKSLPSRTEVIRKSSSKEILESPVFGRKLHSFQSASDDRKPADYERDKSEELPLREELMHMKCSEDILKCPTFRTSYDSLKPALTHSKIGKDKKEESLPLSSEVTRRISSEDFSYSPLIGRRYDSLQSASDDRKQTDQVRKVIDPENGKFIEAKSDDWRDKSIEDFELVRMPEKKSLKTVIPTETVNELVDYKIQNIYEWLLEDIDLFKERKQFHKNQPIEIETDIVAVKFVTSSRFMASRITSDSDLITPHNIDTYFGGTDTDEQAREIKAEIIPTETIDELIGNKTQNISEWSLEDSNLFRKSKQSHSPKPTEEKTTDIVPIAIVISPRSTKISDSDLIKPHNIDTSFGGTHTEDQAQDIEVELMPTETMNELVDCKIQNISEMSLYDSGLFREMKRSHTAKLTKEETDIVPVKTIFSPRFMASGKFSDSDLITPHNIDRSFGGTYREEHIQDIEAKLMPTEALNELIDCKTQNILQCSLDDYELFKKKKQYDRPKPTEEETHIVPVKIVSNPRLVAPRIILDFDLIKPLSVDTSFGSTYAKEHEDIKAVLMPTKSMNELVDCKTQNIAEWFLDDSELFREREQSHTISPTEVETNSIPIEVVTSPKFENYTIKPDSDFVKTFKKDPSFRVAQAIESEQLNPTETVSGFVDFKTNSISDWTFEDSDLLSKRKQLHATKPIEVETESVPVKIVINPSLVASRKISDSDLIKPHNLDRSFGGTYTKEHAQDIEIELMPTEQMNEQVGCKTENIAECLLDDSDLLKEMKQSHTTKPTEVETDSVPVKVVTSPRFMASTIISDSHLIKPLHVDRSFGGRYTKEHSQDIVAELMPTETMNEQLVFTTQNISEWPLEDSKLFREGKQSHTDKPLEVLTDSVPVKVVTSPVLVDSTMPKTDLVKPLMVDSALRVAQCIEAALIPTETVEFVNYKVHNISEYALTDSDLFRKREQFYTAEPIEVETDHVQIKTLTSKYDTGKRVTTLKNDQIVLLKTSKEEHALKRDHRKISKSKTAVKSSSAFVSAKIVPGSGLIKPHKIYTTFGGTPGREAELIPSETIDEFVDYKTHSITEWSLEDSAMLSERNQSHTRPTKVETDLVPVQMLSSKSDPGKRKFSLKSEIRQNDHKEEMPGRRESSRSTLVEDYVQGILTLEEKVLRAQKRFSLFPSAEDDSKKIPTRKLQNGGKCEKSRRQLVESKTDLGAMPISKRDSKVFATEAEPGTSRITSQRETDDFEASGKGRPEWPKLEINKLQLADVTSTLLEKVRENKRNKGLILNDSLYSKFGKKEKKKEKVKEKKKGRR